MTTWTIMVAKPKANGNGFDSAVDSGIRYDDSVLVVSWSPFGSTAALRVRRLLGRLQFRDPAGFKYTAYDGVSTTLSSVGDGSGQLYAG